MMARGRGNAPAEVDEETPSPPGKVRLDKWLWAARFYKTRALAAEAIDGGKGDVQGDRAKRARLVQADDTISLRQGPLEWVVVVRDVAERRGSAEIARQLYEETTEGRRKRDLVTEQLRHMPTAFSYGDGKPGKRDRRALRRLKGDAS
jgi:ribosome-associated heat shock protein Hsp15